MGRIKSMLIKRTAKTLVKTNENCTNDFEQNKKVLEQYNMPDKGTRNKIAGYIGRIKKAGAVPKARKIVEQNEQ